MNLLVELTYDKNPQIQLLKSSTNKTNSPIHKYFFFVCFSAYCFAKTLPPSPALSATKFHEKLKQNAFFIEL